MKSAMYLNTVWLWMSPASSRLRLTAESELPDFTLKATVCPSALSIGEKNMSSTFCHPV